jgi:hypothetical protein
VRGGRAVVLGNLDMGDVRGPARSNVGRMDLFK